MALLSPLSARYKMELCIPRKDMKNGVQYKGHCRNASIAVWRDKEQNFEYQRTKFGSTFPETINHPEDDDGWDLFVPWEEVVNQT